MKNIPKMAVAVGYIDDGLIAEAIEYVPGNARKAFRTLARFVTVAACLCLAASSVFLMRRIYSDEAHNPPVIGDEAKYKVESFDTNFTAEKINLFAYSVVPPQEIGDTVSSRYPTVDCSEAISVFGFSENADAGYWFPVIENGKITDIVFATFDSDGDVITGHSESHADELNSIAKYTSLDTPVYIVAEEFFNYYVIGDTAYVSSDISGEQNEYIGEFAIPNEKLVVVEIQ